MSDTDPNATPPEGVDPEPAPAEPVYELGEGPLEVVETYYVPANPIPDL